MSGGFPGLLHPIWFAPLRALARGLRAAPGERVIDVGAGTGNHSKRMLRSGAEVICLEPDPAVSPPLADASS